MPVSAGHHRVLRDKKRYTIIQPTPCTFPSVGKITDGSICDDIDFLTDAGNEGWELVTITVNNIAYLKRAVASAKRTARPSK